MPTPKVLRLVGGGKRGRTGANVDTGTAIPMVVGRPIINDDDIPAVREMLETEAIHIEAWIDGLSLNDLRNMEPVIDKYISTNGSSDTAIRAYVGYLNSYTKLQDRSFV